jgi:hypothetical protein
MKGYSEAEIFSAAEKRLLRSAASIVDALPDSGPDGLLRCHEVARVVGRLLGLHVVDGFYGFVDHSWLWTSALDTRRVMGRTGFPNILDPYCVGGLPLVRIVHCSPSLPHVGWAYRPGPDRTDIDAGFVDYLISGVRTASAFCPPERERK